MSTEPHPPCCDGDPGRATSGRAATRRRFLAGGFGLLAGSVAAVAVPGRAGAHEVDDQPRGGGGGDGGSDGSGSPGGAASEASVAFGIPPYLNRPAWGADEGLRLAADGTTAYPVAFHRVQKITVHHTASWLPWSAADAVELVQAVYREHVAQDFGDIGYHLLIDPFGTVYEGRFSGGTSFPVYDNWPGWVAGGPRAVNAAHFYNYNAGNIGIALMGDFESHDVTEDAWWALQMTVAMICANTGLDPMGESLYRNPINGVEHQLPNIVAHRRAAGTYCPGEAIVGRFDELRSSVAGLVPGLAVGTWFE